MVKSIILQNITFSLIFKYFNVKISKGVAKSLYNKNNLLLWYAVDVICVSSGSRTPATSTMELFVATVTGFHPLTIATESSIVDMAGALDLSLRVN